MRIDYVSVTLTAESSVAVVAPELVGEAPDSAQLPLRRDRSGNPVIPGSALAGSIRVHLPPEMRERLMGHVEGDKAVRSRVTVHTATAHDAATQRVARTAIDRWRGAAAVSHLFEAEVLAPGAQFVARLELRDIPEGDVQAFLDSLASWRPHLGRGVTTGAGRVRVDSIAHGFLDLSSDGDLLRYLTGGGPALVDSVVEQARVPDRTAGTLLVSEDMEVVDALHVGNGRNSGNRQLLMRSADGRPLIPGTSIKGVLRSRAEYILKSVLEVKEVCTDGTNEDCPVCCLFGYSLPRPDDSGRVGRRGRLRFVDAVVEDAQTQDRPHVAIDRVTGGARDEALFSTEVVTHGRFTLSVEALEEVPSWTRGLLLAALADLDDGYVGLGGGATRGQGTVKCRDGRNLTRDEGEVIRSALKSLMGAEHG